MREVCRCLNERLLTGGVWEFSGNNQYGYQYHFDIMAQSEVLGDNPIVDFTEVTCPGAASTDFAQCQCA